MLVWWVKEEGSKTKATYVSAWHTGIPVMFDIMIDERRSITTKGLAALMGGFENFSIETPFFSMHEFLAADFSKDLLDP
jgi:hypothetical protein